MGMFGQVTIGVCAAVFAMIIAGLIFHKILGAYIEGEIGGLECIVMAGLFVGLVLCIITAPESPRNGLIGFITLLAVAGIPAGKWYLNRKSTKVYFDERIDGYQSAIMNDPGNLAAREQLAEAFYELGRLTESIAQYTLLLEQSPKNREAAYRLRYIQRELSERVASARVCPSCGHNNPGDRTKCESCEGDLSVMTQTRKWLVSGGAKQITKSYTIGVGVIVLVAAMLTLFSSPGLFIVVGLAVIIFLIAQLVVMYMNW